MKRDPRPASDVSAATGLVGLAGLLGWLLVCRNWGEIGAAFDLPGPRAPLSGPYAALAAMLFSGTPMVLCHCWSIGSIAVPRPGSTGTGPVRWAR